MKETSPSRIAALIHLLGDDNPKVVSSAWDHLERIGKEALPLVEEAARVSADVRVRQEAGSFVTEWLRREVLGQWTEYCRGGGMDLEQGVLLIARSEYPALREEECCSQLDEYAGVLKRRLATARTTEAAFQKTAQFLGGERGFSGKNVDYLVPDNSYLNRVLERKEGLPILMSSVYLFVARRVGLDLLGVGMPQHFVVKYRTPDGERFLDPFHDGRSLRRQDCIEMLEKSGIAFQETFLRETSEREILSRILGNLMRAYHSRQDRKRLDRTLNMLRTLEPGETPESVDEPDFGQER